MTTRRPSRAAVRDRANIDAATDAGAVASPTREGEERHGLLDLAALLPALRSEPSFRAVVAGVTSDRGGAADASGTGRISIADPAKAYVLAGLHADLGRAVVVLTARPGQARQLSEELRAWVGPDVRVQLFPAPDALPYESLAEDLTLTAQRVDVLSQLADASARPLIVLSLRAAMELVEPPESFRRASSFLRVGDDVSMATLVDAWVSGGYEPNPLVDAPGQFSRRGGILDVYPPAGPPCRIEFFGNKIESIRVFDLETQRSGERITELRLPPARDRLADSGGEGNSSAASGAVGRPSATFFDHLPPDAVIVVDEPSTLETVSRDIEEQAEETRAHRQERGELPEPVERPYLPWRELRRKLGGGAGASGRLLLELVHDPARETIGFTHAPAFAGRLKEFLNTIVGRGRFGSGRTEHAPGSETRLGERVVIVSQQAARLAELFAERDLHVTPTERLAPDFLQTDRPAIVHGSLGEGWRSEALGVTVYTDGELFGWRKVRRPIRRSRAAAREAFLSDLEPGEMVVHVDHGIARFRGLYRTGGAEPTNGSTNATRDGEGAIREFLLLEYANGDRLYVPSEQADRVTRYVGGGDDAPNLTRLGTSEWSRAKARARRAVRDIAKDLIELYAARRLAQGHAYPPDTTWQRELEDSFPYMETPDQLTAIDDVKRDMQRPEPMDRLLVGDVGYGKTEVALRAAFKAIEDGRQVAVLVPTTVLAQQHFTTFKERFSAFPMRVEVLSRFRSDKEQKAIIEGLTAGAIDIVIGTHRLVSKDVRFKNLGLVIIDEEQRFGVAHKERLKQLRKEVDVLTLTATPIPRTLHMSLAGVRDMSVMETPPEERLPVRTYVAEYDDGLVREAILRELDRGGQVYFVHNRVQSIEVMARRLRELVPEARVLVGHGQMQEENLERVMLDFANGDADILLCTTIIESGLDISNVNTIVIDQAHRLGLAQLYQLRGRVGRGAVRAYAYVLFARDQRLTEQAEQRLRTIFEATELGAGFRIAMKDLEIRGAGNLLGAEQSGQIAAVGFDLYTQLLGEAVELLQAAETGAPLPETDATAPDPRPSLDLPLDAFLPAAYVADEATRLNLYQRFAGVGEGVQLGELISELHDRFGPLPEEAQNLAFLVGLRLQAARASVTQVSASPTDIVVKLRNTPPTDLARLSRQIGSPVRSGSNQLRIPRGRGQGWIVALQSLIDALVPAAA